MAFFKIIWLDVDNTFDILRPLYSNTGRPAKNQIQFLRSFILMAHFKYFSIKKWVNRLKNKMLWLSFAVLIHLMSLVSVHTTISFTFFFLKRNILVMILFAKTSPIKTLIPILNLKMVLNWKILICLPPMNFFCFHW